MYEGDGTQLTLATSRSLKLPPPETKAAMDRCVVRFTEAFPTTGGSFNINLPGGAVAKLRPVPLHGSSAGARTRLTGSIRSRRGFVSVPVEVETAPISASCSELVVRPVGPVCLRSGGPRRLFLGCSHAMADFLCFEIEIAALAAATAPARRVARRTAQPVLA
ncbi:MAG: hypothetical protein ACRD0O_08420 [Acidimicrobiia bacterium]